MSQEIGDNEIKINMFTSDVPLTSTYKLKAWAIFMGIYSKSSRKGSKLELRQLNGYGYMYLKFWIICYLEKSSMISIVGSVVLTKT